jgi:coenzyme F420 hydrogenase subunit beta
MLQGYVGKAADVNVHGNAQSGGIVSALVDHALTREQMGSALTVEMVAGSPPRPRPRLVHTHEEVLATQKSKYCPVPILSCIGEVLSSTEPVVVVGVSCQIHGLYNLLEHYPALREKVAVTIGLICDRMMSYGALDFLVTKGGLPRGTDSQICFRDKGCGGYPGNVSIRSSLGSVSLPAGLRMGIKDFFTPPCCWLCFDKMNGLADISVGDPWGLDKVDRLQGESVAILRTGRGERFFRSAVEAGALIVREINPQSVLKGQRIEHRRSQWAGYVGAWKDMGRTSPRFCEQLGAPRVSWYWRSRCRRHLRHAIILDRYASREVLQAAVERHLLCQALMSAWLWPLRTARRVVTRFKNGIRRGGR